MYTTIIFLLLLGTLSVWGIGATVRAIARDGYRPLPTRGPGGTPSDYFW